MMNRRFKLVNIAFIFIIFVLILIRLNVETTFIWDLMIIILSAIFIIFFIYTRLALWYYKQIIKYFIKEEYEEVILRSKKYFKYFPKWLIGEYIYLSLGVTYFMLDNKPELLTYLNKINSERLLATKYYWLILYHLINNEYSEAKNFYVEYSNYQNSENYPTYNYILTTIFSILEDETINKTEKIDELIKMITNKKIRSYLESLK